MYIVRYTHSKCTYYGVLQRLDVSPRYSRHMVPVSFEVELIYIHTGALGNDRHMLLKCPALADLRDDCFPLVAECSGVMARLVWASNQPMVSSYIIACFDGMSC